MYTTKKCVKDAKFYINRASELFIQSTSISHTCMSVMNNLARFTGHYIIIPVNFSATSVLSALIKAWARRVTVACAPFCWNQRMSSAIALFFTELWSISIVSRTSYCMPSSRPRSRHESPIYPLMPYNCCCVTAVLVFSKLLFSTVRPTTQKRWNSQTVRNLSKYSIFHDLRRVSKSEKN